MTSFGSKPGESWPAADRHFRIRYQPRDLRIRQQDGHEALRITGQIRTIATSVRTWTRHLGSFGSRPVRTTRRIGIRTRNTARIIRRFPAQQASHAVVPPSRARCSADATDFTPSRKGPEPRLRLPGDPAASAGAGAGQPAHPRAGWSVQPDPRDLRPAGVLRPRWASLHPVAPRKTPNLCEAATLPARQTTPKMRGVGTVIPGGRLRLDARPAQRHPAPARAGFLRCPSPVQGARVRGEPRSAGSLPSVPFHEFEPFRSKGLSAKASLHDNVNAPMNGRRGRMAVTPQCAAGIMISVLGTGIVQSLATDQVPCRLPRYA